MTSDSPHRQDPAELPASSRAKPTGLPVDYGDQLPPGGWDRPMPAARAPAELAGWWSRVAASVIDALVVSLPAILIALGMVALLSGPVIAIDDGETSVLVGLLAVLATLAVTLLTVVVTTLVYAPLTMRRRGRRNGQTWGKQLLGIRVIRMDREPTTFASAAVREVLVKLLLFGLGGSLLASIPTILDLLWPLWDRQHRALHDMVVDTRVVSA